MPKLPKMTKIKESLRSIFFIKVTEYHNFSSFQILAQFLNQNYNILKFK